MSDPVRITNPGAESLGYDSDGHEIMAVDIYVALLQIVGGDKLIIPFC
ncbi:hypothetical protein [Escherichia coli]